MNNVFITGGTGRVIQMNTGLTLHDYAYPSASYYPYPKIKQYYSNIGLANTFVRLTNFTVDNPSIGSTSMDNVIHLWSYVNPASAEIEDLVIRSRATYGPLYVQNFENVNINHLYAYGGDLGTGCGRVYVHLPSNPGVTGEGTVVIKNIELDRVKTAGIALGNRNINITQASKIENIYIHDSFDIQYGVIVRIEHNGVDHHPESFIRNVTVRNSNMLTTSLYPWVGVGSWATTPLQFWGSTPFTVDNIDIQDCTCNPIGACVARAIDIRTPANISNIYVRNTVAANILSIEYGQVNMLPSITEWTNITVHNSTAVGHVFRVYLKTLPTTFIEPITSNISFWCNHIYHNVLAAGMFFSNQPMVLHLNRWGGHTFASGVNNTNRHLFAQTTTHGLPATGSLGDMLFDELYYMQIKSLDFSPYMKVPVDGGSPVKVIGDWLLTFADGEYGKIVPANVTFRGIPMRDVSYVYDDEASFVLSRYNEALYTSNEFIMKDSKGRMGMICTTHEYDVGAAPISDIYPANYTFTGLATGHCHTGLKTTVMVYSTKYYGDPLVSIRCNMRRETVLVYGTWNTPLTQNQADIQCHMPCDQVGPGVYSVEIEMLGNNLIQVPVDPALFSMEVHNLPVITSVSSRFILNNVDLFVYGENFPEVTTAWCRYHKSYIAVKASYMVYDVPATYVNSTTLKCTVTSLAAADNPVAGTHMDMYVTFWGLGSGWIPLPRTPYNPGNYVYYNYPFDQEDRPFVYMATYTALVPGAPAAPLSLWSIGRPNIQYTSLTSTGVVYVPNVQEPMICMFESADGKVTFVYPSAYIQSAAAPVTRGLPTCDIPPSPDNAEQTTRVTIGYWYGFGTVLTTTYRYHTWTLNGLLLNTVAPNSWLIFDGVMRDAGWKGYGATVGTNCTTALCYCRYKYMDLSTGLIVTNNANGMVYHTGLDNFRCLVPQLNTNSIKVTLMVNNWELGADLDMTMTYVAPLGPASITQFNGDIGTKLMVTGTGFFDSTSLMCGFARTISGEYPYVFNGRVVHCYDDSVVNSLVVSRAIYINSTNVMCDFDNFVLARNTSIDAPWFRVLPEDAYKYLCRGAYHTVYVGNHPEAFVQATANLEQFQYEKTAQAITVTPSSANYNHQETVIVGGEYIAALGVPTCWWSELLNNYTVMPPAPSQVPQGMYSELMAGEFIIKSTGNEVTCPLPKVDGVAYLGVVIFNNEYEFNSTAFAKFKYMAGLVLTIKRYPSDVTINTEPLAIQPSIFVGDLEGQVIENRYIEVSVKTVPPALAMSNFVMPVNATGYAEFTALRIEGPQYAVFSVCFQAATFDSQSPWKCANYTRVESCSVMTANSVEYNLRCVCARGYQVNMDNGCDTCPVNRYREALNTNLCVDCPEYKITTGVGARFLNECICKPGFETQDDGSCLCPAGSGYNSLTESCFGCPRGTFKDFAGNVACTQCSDQYGFGPENSTSASNCNCSEGFERQDESNPRSLCVCQPGKRFDVNMGLCMPCAVGYYKPTSDRYTECTRCATDETTSEAGSVRLSDCMCKNSFIRYNNNNGDSICGCDRGYEYDDKVFYICQACPPDSYKDTQGPSKCSYCDSTMRIQHTASNSSSECECREGFHIRHEDIGKPLTKCTPCPMGGYCKGGNDRPVAKPGYYESNSVNEIFVKCQVPDACIGQDLCSEGYEGYKCAECSLGFYRRSSRCIQCSTWSTIVFYMAALALVVFMLLTFWISFKPPLVLRLASLRIGWSFIQITALYAQFDLNWPPEIKEVYRFMSFVILDFEITSPECSLNTKIDFYSLLIVKMALPVVFAVVMAVTYGASVVGVKIFMNIRSKQGMKAVTFRGPSVYRFLYFAFIRSCLVLLVMFYVPLVQFVLQYFDCTWQDDGSWSLDAQPSIHCYEGTHMSYFPLVLYGAIAYAIGIPLFCARVLWKNKDRLMEPVVFARFGFLFARFKPKYFYWEIVLMVRLCVLVMCLMLVNTHVPVQTMTGILVLYVSSLQHKDHKPFITDYLNQLESLSLIASVATLLAGQVFYAGIDSPFIITVLTALVLLLLVANILVVVVILYMEWRPPEDPYKDFNEAVSDAPLEAFEDNAGGLVVTMEMGGMEEEDLPFEAPHNFTNDLGGAQMNQALFDTNAPAGAYESPSNFGGMDQQTYSSPGDQGTFASPPTGQFDYGNNVQYQQAYSDPNVMYQQNVYGQQQGYTSNYDQTQSFDPNSQMTYGNDTQMGTQMDQGNFSQY